MRGRDEEAAECRKKFQQAVEGRLQALRPETTNHEHRQPEVFHSERQQTEIEKNTGHVTFTEWQHNWIEMCTDGFYISASSTSEEGAAGWGVAFSEMGECYAFRGSVHLSLDGVEFVGATRASNNTGELSAMLFGCEELYDRDSGKHNLRSVVVLYDSDYAAKMATGKWKPKTNIALVKVVRKWVRRLQAQRLVVFKHVKGHSGAVGNEAAD
eukprot:3460852-Pyramimonas_sp.AAC.1